MSERTLTESIDMLTDYAGKIRRASDDALGLALLIEVAEMLVPATPPSAEDAEQVLIREIVRRIAEWDGFAANSIKGEMIGCIVLDVIQKSDYARHTAAKAVSEHESKLAQIADCINTELRESGGSEIQSHLRDDFRPYIQKLVDLNRARVTKAVADDRQRLLRLVEPIISGYEIEVTVLEEYLRDADSQEERISHGQAIRETRALLKGYTDMRSWLAGEGEKS